MNYHRLHRLKAQITQITLFLVVVLYLTGCGYTTRSFITNKYKTIYVAPFENAIDITKDTDASSRYKTYRPLLETDISREVINRFISDGNLSISRKDEADLTLNGKLVDFRRDALRYTSDEDVEEYRISLKVDLSLTEKDKKLLWEEKALIADTTYFVSGPHAKSESTAIDEAVKDLSRRIVERVIESW